jgi:CheY-like chemotaxis protein
VVKVQPTPLVPGLDHVAEKGPPDFKHLNRKSLMTIQGNILLITSRPAHQKEFVQALDQHEKITVITAESIQEAVLAVEKQPPILVVTDDQVCGLTGLDIVRRLIEVNAFIQTAVISELDDHEFHNRSEGLGILSKLPLIPGEGDALKLIKRLEQVSTNIT